MNKYARQKARRLVMQALYQWDMSQNDPAIIAEQSLAEQNPKKVDFDYFKQLFLGVVGQAQQLDLHLKPYLDRTLDQLDPIELAILRLGVYELAEHLEVPYRVVINEGVELAKLFAGEDSHKYVNSILDKVANQLRIDEIRTEQ